MSAFQRLEPSSSPAPWDLTIRPQTGWFDLHLADLWRYRDLLPIEGEPKTGHHSGWTPFKRATNLEKLLGVKELYIKDDSANYPTWSYKERVVSVAITKAIELGYDTVGCASTWRPK